MATGVSLDNDAFTEVLLQGAQAIGTSNEGYRGAIHSWETKVNEPVPQAKNPSLQEELNKTHSVYQQRIKDTVANLKDLVAVGEELKSLYERQFEPLTFMVSHTDIKNRYDALLSKHKDYEVEVTTLENRIVELMSKS